MRTSGSPDALPPPVFGAARGGFAVPVGDGRCVGRVVALVLVGPALLDAVLVGVLVPGTPVLGTVRAAAVLLAAVVAVAVVEAVVLTGVVVGALVVGFLVVGFVVPAGLLVGRVVLAGLVVLLWVFGVPVAFVLVGLLDALGLRVLDGVGFRVEDPDEVAPAPAEAPEDVTTGIRLGAAVPSPLSRTWTRQ